MVFYAGKLVTAMDNPTIVVITDRNDLDDQLFGSFGRCQHVLRQAPVQSASRAELRSLLKTASGGMVFTTIEKFLPEQKGDRFPMLSERRNIVVIADEAHRSQYDFIYEVASRLFHRFEYKRFFAASPREKMAILLAATEHVLRQKEGKELCLKYVTELSKSFALAVPHEEALRIRDDVGFFQAVRSAIAKNTTSTGTPKEDLDSAIRQIISKAVASNEVVDIFAAAGLKKPDISILSEEFLAEVRGLPYKNLAFELLTKLLNDEIKTRSKKNLIQGRSFSEMLEKAIKRYHNKSIETARIIEDLIELAKEMRKAGQRGEELGLTEDELAFYDALEVNDSAVKVLGDETLRTIARELVQTARNNVTIDWTLKESVQAKLRVMTKRILRKHGYPPDKQKKATETVLEQAAVLYKDWAEAVES